MSERPTKRPTQGQQYQNQKNDADKTKRKTGLIKRTEQTNRTQLIIHYNRYNMQYKGLLFIQNIFKNIKVCSCAMLSRAGQMDKRQDTNP